MKKDLLKALVFPVLWVAYCLVVIIQQPGNQTLYAFSGVLLGSVFLYLTGLLLLRLLPKLHFSFQSLCVLAVLLIAVDQLIKIIILQFMENGSSLQIIGDWLAIRHIPNWNNSVAFALLNISIPATWVAIIKLALIAIAAVVFYSYLRQKKYNIKDNRFSFAIVLLLATAVCSTVETIARGYILDFISLASLVGFDFKDLYMMYGISLFVIVVFEWEYHDEKQRKRQA